MNPVSQPMKPSRDIPKLETYPWALLGGLTLLWGVLWFTLWTALRGTTASLIIAFGSLQDMKALPLLVPGQLVLWLFCVAWTYKDLKQEKSPPLIVFALCILLLTTFTPTAFYMMRLVTRMTAYELSHNPTAVHFLGILQGNSLDFLTLFLCFVLGSTINLKVLRKKYPGLQPQKKSWILGVWVIALLGAIAIGFWCGTLFGILFGASLGNAFAIRAYRKTIVNRLKAEEN